MSLCGPPRYQFSSGQKLDELTGPRPSQLAVNSPPQPVEVRVLIFVRRNLWTSKYKGPSAIHLQFLTSMHRLSSNDTPYGQRLSPSPHAVSTQTSVQLELEILRHPCDPCWYWRMVSAS